MKAFFVFLERVAFLLTGLPLIVGGYGFFLLDPPSPAAGSVLIGLGLLIISLIVWPDQASAHSSATTTHRFSFEEECRAGADHKGADHKVVHLASYRKKSGQVSARGIAVYRPRADVGDSLCV